MVTDANRKGPTITVSKSVLNMFIQSMVDNNIKESTQFGVTLSTEKTEHSIPTGYTLASGEQIYIQP